MKKNILLCCLVFTSISVYSNVKKLKINPKNMSHEEISKVLGSELLKIPGVSFLYDVSKKIPLKEIGKVCFFGTCGVGMIWLGYENRDVVFGYNSIGHLGSGATLPGNKNNEDKNDDRNNS